MKKNILAENMRRFGTKNLVEDADQNNNGFPDNTENTSNRIPNASDWRNPGYPSSNDFNKMVRQIKSRYLKSYDIDINDEDIAIVTDSGYDIRIVDHPNRKKISAELESDNLPRGFVTSKEYEYTEIDRIFKIIDLWLKKYEWL